MMKDNVQTPLHLSEPVLSRMTAVSFSTDV